MGLANLVLAVGNLTVVAVLLGILLLAVVGFLAARKAFTPPDRPDHNEPRI